MTSVTVFKTFKDVDKPYYVGIHKVLDGIRDGNVKELVQKIRAEKDEAEISRLKKELPCVLYAGVFNIPITKEREDGTYYKSYRTDESLSMHSKYIPFDVDDIDDIEKYKEDAKKDPFVYAMWTSPSGKGLHGLIKIADGSRHEEHYTALLKRYPVFDPTARNPSRVLFFSYDPNIYINENSKVFFEVSERTITQGQNMTEGFTDYKRLGVAAKIIRIAEQGGRHHSVLKAAYLVGGLITGGIVEEYIGRMVLEYEVKQKFDPSEVAIELKAIEDGIKAGKFMPISDIERYEAEVWKEVGQIEEELSFLSDNRNDEDYMRRYRAGLIPMGKPFGYEDMDKYLMLKEGEFMATLSHSHTGKAQPLSSKILTPSGWKTMADIKVGDSICGINGVNQTVVGIYPQGLRRVYKVNISDGTCAYCDEEHLWSVNRYYDRHKGKKDENGINRYNPDYTFKTMPLIDMIGKEKLKGKRKNGLNNFMLPSIGVVKFSRRKIFIDPYLLGIILGDGCITSVDTMRIQMADEDIAMMLCENEYIGNISIRRRDNRLPIYNLPIKHSIIPELKTLGLFGCRSESKFIPEDYIYNDVGVRLDVLSGLMDSDGTVDKYGLMSFSTISERLRDGVIEIVNSLGGRCKVKRKVKKYRYLGELKEGKPSYNISIKLPPDIIPFKLDRKINKISENRREVFKYIESIEYSHLEECQCIKVSNEDQLYITDNYIPTHNTTVNLWLIFLSALKYDWCWVIYTGENKVASVKMRLSEFYVGMKIKDMPEDFFQQSVKFVNERFFFINNDNMHSYEEILNYAESVSKYHSIKGLLIDPVNALKIGKQNKYDHEMEMYTNMLLFTKRTNITVFLSIHTRTQAQRERSKDGNQLMPFPADADGGAVLYNKCDIFITMNRNIQDPETWMVTELFVNKMRNKESGGEVTPKNQSIKIKMQKGIEFTDEYGNLPFDRNYLRMDKKLISDVRDEDIEEDDL